MNRRFVAAAALALLATACHVGSRAESREPGPEVSRTYQVGAFDKLAVSGPYEVNVVSGGQGGIGACTTARSHGENYDLVMTDLGMPYVDGRKVAAAIKVRR